MPDTLAYGLFVLLMAAFVLFVLIGATAVGFWLYDKAIKRW